MGGASGRFASRLVGVGLVLVVGAGLTVLGLWLGGVVWSGSDDKSDSFCRDIEEWHTSQATFQGGMNQPGARDERGLSTSFDLLEDSAAIGLPKAKGHDELALREVMRGIARVNRAWLLKLVEVLRQEGAIEFFEDAEEQRLALNDLLGEVNARTDDMCPEILPLPTHSEQ